MDPGEGAEGQDPPPPPPKNHKNIGFLSNVGPDLLKNYNFAKPAFNIGPSSADDGLLLVVFGSLSKLEPL